MTCFCEFCVAKAKERGINVERARKGFLELEKFVRSARSGKRPVDGYYVQFWRILLRYPEVAAWEMLFTDGLRETYAAIYKTVKTAKPAVPVGWHIWHNNSFNPIYRAEQDLHELSNYSDFIKVVMYNNCGGERMALYADNITSTLYGDLSKQALLDMNYSLMGFKEGTLRTDSPHRTFRRLRLPRNQARPGWRRRHQNADSAQASTSISRPSRTTASPHRKA